MAADKVANWVQVGANIGILASLLILGSQVYQGFELGRLGLHSEEEDAYLSVWTTSTGEKVAAALAHAIDDPKSLNSDEMIELNAYYEGIISILHRREYLHDIGVFNDPIDTWVGMVRRNFGNKFAVAWWEERRKGMKMLATRKLVDEVIAANDVNGQAVFYGNIRQSLEES